MGELLSLGTLAIFAAILGYLLGYSKKSLLKGKTNWPYVKYEDVWSSNLGKRNINDFITDLFSLMKKHNVENIEKMGILPFLGTHKDIGKYVREIKINYWPEQ